MHCLNSTHIYVTINFKCQNKIPIANNYLTSHLLYSVHVCGQTSLWRPGESQVDFPPTLHHHTALPHPRLCPHPHRELVAPLPGHVEATSGAGVTPRGQEDERVVRGVDGSLVLREDRVVSLGINTARL